jgi:hypothetical protein
VWSFTVLQLPGLRIANQIHHIGRICSKATVFANLNAAIFLSFRDRKGSVGSMGLPESGNARALTVTDLTCKNSESYGMVAASGFSSERAGARVSAHLGQGSI